MTATSPTPLPGDELRVDRGLYHHHGIYVGDGLVVPLGGRVKDKPHASIHHTSLVDFAKGARVKVVEHADLDRDASRYAPNGWLATHRTRPTTSSGSTASAVARWCATERAECLQAQSALAFNSIGAAVFMVLDHPGGPLVGLGVVVIGLLVAWLSRVPTRQFERHIEKNWPGRPAT